MFDEPMEVHEAPEPTNLKWENLGKDYKMINRNKLIVFIALVVFLGLAFSLFTYLKQAVVISNKKYPPTMNCDYYKDIKSEDLRLMAL